MAATYDPKTGLAQLKVHSIVSAGELRGDILDLCCDAHLPKSYSMAT